jgi:dephospho-CoA kinase
MLIVGLVGGIASGKSEVARQLQSLGAAWLDADRAGHEVLREDAIKTALRQHFGEQIFSSDGEVDRSRLAARVFGTTQQHAAELKYLESLTHPRIRQKLSDHVQQWRASGCRVAVLDAPVLLKAGWREFCDRLVFVDAPRESRLQRALSRGWTEEEFDAREAAQESLQAKREAADLIMDNSGSLDGIRTQVVRFWQSLVG